MHFLVDADLPRSAAAVVRRFGHEATDVRDIGMGEADDDVIAVYAKEHQLCLLTGDFDFADIRAYPPREYFGLAVLEVPADATAEFIVKMIGGLMNQPEVLQRLSGRLAIVDPGRTRVR